jgi:hypothetical protein
VIRNLFLISLVLVACQNINENRSFTSPEELDKFFKSSKEYSDYKKSTDLFLMVLKKYKINELDLIYTCTNSGEAIAFELFIKNNTDFTFQVMTTNISI